jgi:hypothetical protein
MIPTTFIDGLHSWVQGSMHSSYWAKPKTHFKLLGQMTTWKLSSHNTIPTMFFEKYFNFHHPQPFRILWRLAQILQCNSRAPYPRKITLKRFSQTIYIYMYICQNCWQLNPQLLCWNMYWLNHWVTITNACHKLYFIYLFLNCWNSKNLNLKLPNLVFYNKEINKYSTNKCPLQVVATIIATFSSSGDI